MFVFGGLGNIKADLDCLQLGQSYRLINNCFCTRDIQECCDVEFPDKKFLVERVGDFGYCTPSGWISDPRGGSFFTHRISRID